MAFPPSKSARHRRKEKGELMLTSMMDMMTIILLFLLKTMGSAGALLRPSPYVELPKAQREREPQKSLSILIREDAVLEDMEKNPRVIVPQEELENPNNVILPSLENFLNDHKEFTQRLGKVFKGEVTIQCDKDVTYDKLLKVINTCGQSEYGTLNFVVLKERRV